MSRVLLVVVVEGPDQPSAEARAQLVADQLTQPLERQMFGVRHVQPLRPELHTLVGASLPPQETPG